jgi:predicted enzyme related to lactoylglutathione lyase
MQMTKTAISTAPLYSDIPAKDINRAHDYYQNTLGLDVQDVQQQGMLFYGSAGRNTQFLVYQTDATDSATVATFLVDDIMGAKQDLEGRGVKFEEYDMPNMKTVNGIVDYGPGGKVAWFKDSEGNVLSLGEMTYSK